MIMQPDPVATVLQVAGGYCLPRCLHVAAELGVADALEEEAATAVELARRVGANPDALARVLRLLSAHGIFEQAKERFRHSAASRLLREDHPHSLRAFVRMFGLPINWAICGALEHSVRTGGPAAPQIFPGGFWAYFAQHPEDASIFNAAMAAKAHGQVDAVIAAYDFSRFNRIADIGGGRGHLLSKVLGSAPQAHGVLFELPHVIEEVQELASARLALQAGDFFKDALPACDAYLLMEVVHDWADSESLAILAAIRRAARPGAKLLVIEQLVPHEPGPDWTKMLDIHMLAFFAARQRTLGEYRALLTQAGFSFEREVPTRAGISLLEASLP